MRRQLIKRMRLVWLLTEGQGEVGGGGRGLTAAKNTADSTPHPLLLPPFLTSSSLLPSHPSLPPASVASVVITISGISMWMFWMCGVVHQVRELSSASDIVLNEGRELVR